MGDYNLHHELWGGSNIRRPDPHASELIELMDEYDLTSQLPAGTVTYEEGESRTTIDLCLTTIGLTDKIIRCEIDDKAKHDSDHLPIVTSFNLAVPRHQQQGKRNWKAIDETAYTKTLRNTLPDLQRPRTRTSLDRYVQEIVETISTAIDKAVPITFHSHRSKAGWNNECSEILAKTKQLRRIHSREHTEQSWEAYRAARNQKGRVIRKALRTLHREKVEQAADSPTALWKLAKWSRTRQNTPTVTPELQNGAQTATTPEDKVEMFKEAFFPAPPEAALGDMEGATYNNQVTLPLVTAQAVSEAIHDLAPLKAPGPDRIINRSLQLAEPWITPHLVRIFNQSLALGYCPSHFRESTIVVLRKPGKPNYATPKAYRPIALLNTVGKVMDAIIAKRLSYITEKHQMLPPTHVGGRKRRSTEHALHLITDEIYGAWNTGSGKVASLLLLDVSGAFDNVSHQRLLHNLRKRRVDETTVRWIASFLSHRQIRIHIDGFTSEEYTLTTGIPQGSPLSLILYLFYNADLLDGYNQLQGTTATGFIDDIAILAVGDTTDETNQSLQEALQIAEGWAATHASLFAPDKFQLTHFTRARTKFDTSKILETRWGQIVPKGTCKYLGLTMDTSLRWKQHIDETERKVTNTINALSSLGSSTWGVKTKEMRTIYNGVAIPQMMYACSLWSNASWGGKGYTKRTLQRLEKLQARAARSMCGAYRATSSPALDVEMHLTPIEQQIRKHNLITIGRIQDAASQQQPNTTQDRARRSPRDTIRQELQRRPSPNGINQETIKAFIVPPWWQRPRFYIESNAEQAMKEHQKQQDHEMDAIHVYTDGSGINGHIGAAAVCTTTHETKSTYMGTETTSTVYAGELQGIILALQLAQADRATGNKRSKLLIYTDNQAAIRSSANSRGKSGAYLLEIITREIQQLRDQGLNTEIRWIPAHTGIMGNEAADKAAKEATGWRESGEVGPPAEQPPQLFSLQSTLATWAHKEANKARETKCKADTKGRTTARFTPRPTKKILRLHEGLSKRHSAILVQMRTEKIGLKHFLFNRRVPGIMDDKCTCREGQQTVSHVLMQCRQFRQLRQREFGSNPWRHNLRSATRIAYSRKSSASAGQTAHQLIERRIG